MFHLVSRATFDPRMARDHLSGAPPGAVARADRVLPAFMLLVFLYALVALASGWTDPWFQIRQIG